MECSYLDNELQIQRMVLVLLSFSVLYLLLFRCSECLQFFPTRYYQNFLLLSKRSLSEQMTLRVGACFIHFNILRPNYHTCLLVWIYYKASVSWMFLKPVGGKKIGSKFLSNVIFSPKGKRKGSCVLYWLNN